MNEKAPDFSEDFLFSFLRPEALLIQDAGRAYA
jgi:hypothetical protein